MELIHRERWQRLQDHFSRVLAIGLRTVSPAKEILIPPSWPSGPDGSRVSETLKLGKELEELFPSAQMMPQVTTATTQPLGHSFAAVPLRATPETIVAYLVAGPVLLGRREEADSFRQRAKEMDIDPEPVWELLLATKLYSYGSFKSILAMLEEIGNTLLELAYQGKQLAGMVPLTPQVDRVMVKHHSERLWQSLLDVACTSTKAQGGSVMLYEATSDSFRIVAQQGLSGEVASQASVKMGEGIVGLAAARGEILLLDDQVQDPELRARMRRPELVSSLTAPFLPERGGRSRGVLSVRTSDSRDRFRVEDVEVLRKLTQLTQTAFAAFQLLTGWSGPS